MAQSEPNSSPEGCLYSSSVPYWIGPLWNHGRHVRGQVPSVKPLGYEEPDPKPDGGDTSSRMEPPPSRECCDSDYGAHPDPPRLVMSALVARADVTRAARGANRLPCMQGRYRAWKHSRHGLVVAGRPWTLAARLSGHQASPVLPCHIFPATLAQLMRMGGRRCRPAGRQGI